MLPYYAICAISVQGISYLICEEVVHSYIWIDELRRINGNDSADYAFTKSNVVYSVQSGHKYGTVHWHINPYIRFQFSKNAQNNLNIETVLWKIVVVRPLFQKVVVLVSNELTLPCVLRFCIYTYHNHIHSLT